MPGTRKEGRVLVKPKLSHKLSAQALAKAVAGNTKKVLRRKFDEAPEQWVLVWCSDLGHIYFNVDNNTGEHWLKMVDLIYNENGYKRLNKEQKVLLGKALSGDPLAAKNLVSSRTRVDRWYVQDVR